MYPFVVIPLGDLTGGRTAFAFVKHSQKKNKGALLLGCSFYLIYIDMGDYQSDSLGSVGIGHLFLLRN